MNFLYTAKNKDNLRWIFVGTVTVALDFFFFIILYNLTSHIFFSNLISGVFASSINFGLHRYWTFQSVLSTRVLLTRYFYLVTLLYVTGSISTYMLIDVGVSAPFSKCLAIALNLLLSRLGTWKVFRTN